MGCDIIENYVDLSNCKNINKNGKQVIDWNNSIGTIVPFYFNGIESFFVIEEYIKNGSKVKIRFNNSIYEIQSASIRNCYLGKLFLKTHKYNTGEVVNSKEIIASFITRVGKKKNKTLMYKVKCLLCGNISETTERGVDSNKGCSFCHGNLNHDLLCNTDPELIIYFQEKDVHYFYEKSYGSSLELDFVCPYCKTIKRISINTLHSNGLGCICCSDGVSSGEKYFYNLLSQLKISFDFQYKFQHSTILLNKKYSPVYDFVVHDKKIIIEIDGEHHHTLVKTWNNVNQDLIDKTKDKFAMDNGYKTIRIPYISQDFDNFQLAIENQLSSFWDLSNIDYSQCRMFAVKSSIHETIELWNQGFPLKDITVKLNKDKGTIRKYLELGKSLGLCDYSEHLSRSRGSKNSKMKHKKIICLDNGAVFDSISACQEYFEKQYNLEIKYGSIMENLRKRNKTAKGYRFEYYEEKDNVDN